MGTIGINEVVAGKTQVVGQVSSTTDWDFVSITQMLHGTGIFGIDLA